MFVPGAWPAKWNRYGECVIGEEEDGTVFFSVHTIRLPRGRLEHTLCRRSRRNRGESESEERAFLGKTQERRTVSTGLTILIVLIVFS